MAKFKVEQKVLCEVNVWYELEADSVESALINIASWTDPTANPDADHEIVSDTKILKTTVTEV